MSDRPTAELEPHNHPNPQEAETPILVDVGVNKTTINEEQKADISRLITYYFRAAALVGCRLFLGK
ncbi:hypothetical protein [Xenococcus sp. PCC 7305]|uniref:hypothetical protein n=1 Tax=Xenococcus sp. PCC 7305 TaxID=102125 RepID=UPI0002DC6663|nr:hypothetical protein [Xenococcus sp. PCC 7305]